MRIKLVNKFHYTGKDGSVECPLPIHCNMSLRIDYENPSCSDSQAASCVI